MQASNFFNLLWGRYTIVLLQAKCIERLVKGSPALYLQQPSTMADNFFDSTNVK